MRTAVLAGAVSCISLGALALAAPQGPGTDPAASIPTYAKDIAPILFKNCTSCHRPGEIAPMSLLTYEDVRPRAKDIRDKVADGIMPPWHADMAPGTFLNERGLSERDKTTIFRWVANGAPKGDVKDLPPAPAYPTGWSIGKPDVVFEMPEDYRIPADDVVQYEYFYIPTNFKEAKWVQAIEVRPGAPSVVHHVLVFAGDRGRNGRGAPTPFVERPGGNAGLGSQLGEKLRRLRSRRAGGVVQGGNCVVGRPAHRLELNHRRPVNRSGRQRRAQVDSRCFAHAAIHIRLANRRGQGEWR